MPCQDRKGSALREAGTLQAQTEASEILDAPFLLWILRSKSHCFDQFGLGHARTVVGQSNPGFIGDGVGDQFYRSCASRDCVVNYVGKCGFKAVAKVTVALDE